MNDLPKQTLDLSNNVLTRSEITGGYYPDLDSLKKAEQEFFNKKLEIRRLQRKKRKLTTAWCILACILCFITIICIGLLFKFNSNEAIFWPLVYSLIGTQIGFITIIIILILVQFHCTDKIEDLYDLLLGEK